MGNPCADEWIILHYEFYSSSPGFRMLRFNIYSEEFEYRRGTLHIPHGVTPTRDHLDMLGPNDLWKKCQKLHRYPNINEISKKFPCEIKLAYDRACYYREVKKWSAEESANDDICFAKNIELYSRYGPGPLVG